MAFDLFFVFEDIDDKELGKLMTTTSTIQCMTEKPSNGALLAAALDGDQIAWKQLVDRLQGAIWGATSRLGLTAVQADDVFQTVWLRLLDRHETIRDPERLAGWLKTVAHNEGLAILRHQARDQPTELIDLNPSPVDGPEATVEGQTNSQLMVAGFGKLSDDCKDLLYLIATKVPYRVISERLGMAVGSIGPSRNRCLKVLRSFSEVKEAMEPAS